MIWKLFSKSLSRGKKDFSSSIMYFFFYLYNFVANNVTKLKKFKFYKYKILIIHGLLKTKMFIQVNAISKLEIITINVKLPYGNILVQCLYSCIMIMSTNFCKYRKNNIWVSHISLYYLYIGKNICGNIENLAINI